METVPIRSKGFTLIELMIVVVIISILAAISYPSYTQYVTRTRRTGAESYLLQIAARQEKLFTKCGWYASTLNGAGAADTCGASAGSGQLAMSNTSADVSYYTFSTGPDTSTGGTNNIALGYMLTATPSAPQSTNDADCGNLTYTSAGVKAQSGPNVQGRCWNH